MKLKKILLLGLFLCLDGLVFAQRPNIVMILLDDADKNLIPPNAPSFVNVPQIKRIYKEGALFTNYYCVFSYCNPARSSLITGVYPHVHGAVDNVTKITNTSLPFFTSILQSAGYHNICIGKYTNVEAKPPYFEKSMCITTVNYTNPVFTLNGGQKVHTTGNTTRIIDDSMANWISKVDTPFFAWIGHIAPHPVVKLPSQDVNKYKNKNIHLPVTAHYFADDYPSFLYQSQSNYSSDSAMIRSNEEKEYEALLEVDRGIGRLFDTLTKRGILDNTMIVFTNDNGAFYGEHYLLGKQKPYEAGESMPLFIRYPPYFNINHPKVNTQLLLSFDLTPTFLSVAGIDPAPYNFQGISLDHQIFNGGIRRSCVFFEKIKTATEGGAEDIGEFEAPSWRAVRTHSYKYVRYQCDSLVEELFDMKNDSLENTNLARNSNYNEALDSMRLLLDSMIIATYDTISVDTFIGNCYLVDLITNQRLAAALPFEVIAYPQPASDYVQINFIAGSLLNYNNSDIEMELFNQYGSRIESWRYSPSDGLSMTIDTHNLSGGLYFFEQQEIIKAE